MPEWEDPKNAEGGSLILNLDHLTEVQIDEIWKNILFSLVGCTLPHHDKINGVRYMDKLKKFSQIKFELWMEVGQGKGNINEETLKKNRAIRDEITEGIWKTISKTIDFSIHSITYKDHYIAKKA